MTWVVEKPSLKISASETLLLIIYQVSAFPWPVPASSTQSSFLLSSSSRSRSITHEPSESPPKRTTLNACTYSSVGLQGGDFERCRIFLIGRMPYRIGCMSGKGAQMLFFFSAVISQIGFGRTAQDSLGSGMSFLTAFWVIQYSSQCH